MERLKTTLCYLGIICILAAGGMALPGQELVTLGFVMIGAAMLGSVGLIENLWE